MKSVTGKTQITLPSEFKQIIVEVFYGTSSMGYNFNICYKQLTNSVRQYIQGEQASGNNNYCRINVTKGSVILNSFYTNGSDVSATSTVTVYYM